jgi:hypothetical protein
MSLKIRNLCNAPSQIWDVDKHFLLEDFGDDSQKLSFCYVTQILHIKPLNFQPINKVMVSKISQKGMQETEVCLQIETVF